MTGPSEILRHVVRSIVPASEVHAAAARDRIARGAEPATLPPLAPAGAERSHDTIARLSGMLGGAQHSSRPVAKQRFVVVVAGSGDPAPAAAHAILSGASSLAHMARSSETPIVLVNAGSLDADRFPAGTISLGPGLPRAGTDRVIDLDAAYRALDAGIALAVSLSEQDLALLAVGSIGCDGDIAAFRDSTATPDSGAHLLAEHGGSDLGVLAGLMLGAAATRIPVILDSYATGVAGLVAAAIAPNVTGYLIAAHRGSCGPAATEPGLAMAQVLDQLGLVPLVDVGLGVGDGTGAAMVLPFADEVAARVGKALSP